MQGTRVASRYAKSFIDLTMEQGVLEKAYADMKQIVSICKTNHEFVTFLKSPIIKTDKKLAVLKEIFEGKLDKVTATYINLITSKKREMYLPDIAAEFIHQYNIKKQILKAVVTSANGIDEVTRKKIMELVKEKNTSEVIIEEKIDKAPISTKDDPKVNSILGFLIQFGVVAVLFFGIGFVLGQKKYDIQTTGIVPKISVQGQANQVQNVDFSLFWKVFETLPQTYFDKTAVDGQKMMYGAIAGMVRSLGDPYTSFLDPKQNESVKGDLSGSYEGVGIQLGFDKEKRLVVISPLKGTPAEREGRRR